MSHVKNAEDAYRNRILASKKSSVTFLPEPEPEALLCRGTGERDDRG